ncbi:6-O-methylguanine DNA methyltransferase [Candidatus Peregrinibacteria bacterium CG_4_9_14_0_2_um_filter_53_11]|nr:MAG: 6-O-methylguanine DNA methyltransferase [Candidatus Peregrinibacteria bacterium CG_4_9_14_0_2_um_filter_53_11]
MPSIYNLSGTEFQKAVWRELSRIPKGTTITYAELAARIGRPKSVRAVANAVGANPLPVTVPCHRVIRTDGTLGGYSGPGGVTEKRRLLKAEGVDIRPKNAL